MGRKMNPALFIISRTDMASMNPGRAIAQGSHATSLFEARARELTGVGNIDGVDGLTPQDQRIREQYKIWQNSANGFGVTYVYETDAAGLKSIDDELGCLNYEVLWGKVVDPDYIVKDGDWSWIQRDVETCHYIFGDTDKIRTFLRKRNIKFHR